MESSYFSVVMVSLISLALVLFHSTKHFEVEAHDDQRNISFKIDLIHRDSTLSPFYNASETNSDRLRNAILRSMSRVNHFDLLASSQPNTIQSDVIPNGGNYLMKLSIGTPPVEVLAIADTGSDLTWTQCKPCPECYMQDAPLFDPQHSSTYKSMACDSSYCQALPGSQCSSSCEYSYSYVDRSYTEGELANEVFTFSSTNGQSVPIPNFVFGCGHRNGGTFNSHGSGLVGLGGGALSLVSQLREEIDAKFSYCLVPMFDKSTSKLNFGSSATISSPGMVSTPLAPTNSLTFYSLTLKGISFGNDRIDNVGNIIIDSGTTLTSLNENLYTQLQSMVKGAVNRPPVYPYGNYPFCYDAKEELTIPETTFHFNGADLKLGQMNVFFRASEDLLCFSMVPSQSISFFGNLAQVNFQVEYDLNAKKVSFAPADCTKF